MGILTDTQRIIEIAERGRPRLIHSTIWRMAKNNLLRSAAKLEWQSDTMEPAREGSQGEFECNKDLETQGAYSPDLNDSLTKLLGRQPRATCTSSNASPEEKVVRLNRSTRLPRT